jgi:hypothetical protein
VTQKERKAERAALITLVLGTAASITTDVLGVSGLPSWAFLAASAGVTLAASVLAYAALAARHRVPALWVAVALLALSLFGSWIYDAESGRGSANFVADTFVPFSFQPGGPPDSSYNAKGLTEGAVNTAHCYVTVKGAVWLDFGNDQWLARTAVHPAPGFPDRLPPRCH